MRINLTSIHYKYLTRLSLYKCIYVNVEELSQTNQSSEILLFRNNVMHLLEVSNKSFSLKNF